MSERCIPTALVFKNAATALQTGSAVGIFSHMALCGESMAGFDVDTTDFTDEITREEVAPTLVTTTKTDDTVKMEKDAWKPGADEIFGAGVACGLEDATIQIFHEWAASVTFEANDTVKETISLQVKQGS